VRARRSVGVVGEHSTWWINCAMLLAVKVAATLAAMAVRGNGVVGGLVGGILGTKSIIHNPVHMHLLPHIIVRPQCIMIHPFFCEEHVRPALQSVTTLISACDAKPWMMWARHTRAERWGKSNVNVCLDCTWSPLGRCAMMGLLATCTLVTGVPVVRKLIIEQESKTAHLLIVSISMLIV
jgi:hypothetical protein